MVNICKINNVEMEYIKFGQGKKIFVMIPGLSIKSVLLSENGIKAAYQAFDNDYTVYLFDRRLNMPENYSIDEMAEDTYQIMKKLELSDIYLFGASQGGMIAQVIAMNHPEIVKKLIVGSSTCKITKTSKNAVGKWIEYASNGEVDNLVENSISMIYSKATVEAYHDILVAGNSNITDQELKRFIICANAAKNFNISNQLSQIKCPVLIMYSKGDQIFNERSQKFMINKLNASYYAYGKEFGHGVYDEASDYKEKMLDFYHD